MELVEEQVDFILTYDNGDWTDDLIIHWCLGPDLCPCGGNRAVALKQTLVAVALSVGNGCCVALGYRWKHQESASSYIFRFRSQHRLMDRVWVRTYKKKDILQAGGEAMQAAADGRDAVAARQTVRAGKIGQYLEKDPENRTYLFFLIIQTPMQKRLDEVLAAEKAVNTFHDLIANSDQSSSGPGCQPRGFHTAKEDALTKNLDVLTARSGKRILA